MKTKLLITICLSITLITSRAQSYTFKAPTYTATGGGVTWLRSVEEITIEPNRILFTLRFMQKYNSFTVRLPTNTVLSIPAIYQTFPISSIIGAQYGDNRLKSGRNHEITLIFNVDWKQLVEASDNPLFVLDIRSMKIASGKDFLEGEAGWGGEEYMKWRIDGLYIPINMEQQLTLVAASILNSSIQKGEFETTAQYTARTSADSLYARIWNGLRKSAKAIYSPYVNRLLKATPTATYNADNELFTISYPGSDVQTVQVKVPLAQAKEFKEKLSAKRIGINDASIILSKGGNFYAKEIVFYDYDKKQYFTLANEIKPTENEDVDGAEKRIMNELIKKHPYGKMLKAS